MSLPPRPPSDPPPPAPPPLIPRGVVSSPLTHFLGWFLTSLVVLTIVLLNFWGSRLSQSSSEEGSDPLNIEFLLTGKLLIGAEGLGLPDGLLRPSLAELIAKNTPERLAKAILRSQLGDSEGAIDSLESIRMELDPENEQERLLFEDVSRLLRAGSSGALATPLDEASITRLHQLLPFYGPLLEAEVMRDRPVLEQLRLEATKVTTGLLGVGLWYLLAFAIGGLLLSFFLLSIWIRSLDWFRHLAFDLKGRTGSIYVETFGLWVLAFFGFSFLFEFILRWNGLTDQVPELNLVGSLLAFFASLFVLCWPCIRGIPSSQMRQQCGLFTGGKLFAEIGCGFLVYTTAIPMLLCGLVLSSLLGWVVQTLFGPQAPPSHPVTELLGGSVTKLVLVYLVACVAAPIVEEIMFRGVLYRYLRECSRGTGLICSFLFSALVSSFIFAVIHPQGLVFVPVLGALAVAFCLGREWRGSIVSPIVAHAINNVVTVTLGLILLS